MKERLSRPSAERLSIFLPALPSELALLQNRFDSNVFGFIFGMPTA